jgi:hypothetical protein
MSQAPGRTAARGEVEQARRDGCKARAEVGEARLDAGLAPPEVGVAPLEAGFAPPEVGLTPPEVERTPHEAGLASFEVGVAPHEAGLASSEVDVAPPEVGLAPPEVGLTPHEAGLASLEVGLTSSEVGLAPSQVAPTPPDAALAPRAPCRTQFRAPVAFLVKSRSSIRAWIREGREAHPGPACSPLVARRTEDPMSLARVIVALHLPTRVADLLVHSLSVVSAMKGNAFFSSPTPSLTVVSTHIQELHLAEVTARSRVMGGVEARDLARFVLVSDLNQLKAYVQVVADADRAQAETIITSAGMFVRTFGARQKQVFAVVRGERSGEARIYAPVVEKDATYLWQMSADGTTWIDLPPTRQASTLVTGLVPFATSYFRYRVVLREGLGDWSEARSLMVL